MASAPITGTETTEDTGSSDTTTEDPLADIKAAVTKNLTEGTKGNVTVTGYVGDIDISLSGDITGHMEIPSSWGTVLLDLCGHTFTSNCSEGAVILTGDHIEGASVIISNEGAQEIVVDGIYTTPPPGESTVAPGVLPYLLTTFLPILCP